MAEAVGVWFAFALVWGGGCDFLLANLWIKRV